MPKFSVIVPTRNVQGYVRTCLESVLAQTIADFELIVVDDASTDDTVQIVNQIAAGHQHVKVLELPQQLDGPGLLRNIAIEQAEGEWLVFVDSDDWVEPELLETIAAATAKGEPDVVLYDYDRAYWWGRRTRNANAQYITQLGGRVVRGLDHPELFELMQVAWNKAVRRTFWDEQGFVFPRGIYEDQPINYAMLATSSRIAVVDAALYHYRQRRAGNLLRTESTAHFDVLEQWDLAMDLVDDLGCPDDAKALVFDRMFNHSMHVYGHRNGRLPKSERRKFFDQMSQTYQRHRPPNFLDHPRISPVRSWLVSNGAFGRYEAFKVANRLRLRGRRSRRGLVRTLRARSRKLRNWSMSKVYRHVFCRLPIEQDLAVYAAYWDSQYACNPKAIYEEALRTAPEVRGVWSVNARGAKRVPEQVPTISVGSWRWWRTMATAKYFINNVNFPNDVKKRPGQVHLQTQHGTPLKSMGIDLMNYPVAAKNQSFKNLLLRSDRWDYCLSSNHYSTEIWARAYPCQYTVWNSGYPRNDVLVNQPPGVAERVRKSLRIPERKKIILYAPTLRDHEKNFSFPFDVERLEREIGDEYTILVRVHYLVGTNSAVSAATDSGFLVDVSNHPNIEELCLASDLLVTDYSSVMFDYANLGRPIVIYAHDWDTYSRTRGTYFDLIEAPPGVVARNDAELVSIIESKEFGSERARELLDEFRAAYCEFDDGHASERVVRALFHGDVIQPQQAGQAA